MWSSQQNSESGFAVAWVVAILMVAGIIVAAMLQLAPISLRAAIREQQSVQALAHAESGVAYALNWFETDAFESLGSETTILEDRELGDGGISKVVVTPQPDSTFIIGSTGYQSRSETSATKRTVQVRVKLVTSGASGMFPRHWVTMSDLPANPLDPAYGYQQTEMDWTLPPPPEKEVSGLPLCDQNQQDIVVSCRWQGNYNIGWTETPPYTIDAPTVHVTGNLDLGAGWPFVAQNTRVYIDGVLNAGYTLPTTFTNVEFWVGHNGTFNAGTWDFYGGTKIYTQNNLTMGESGKLDFHGETVLHVGGDLSFVGGGGGHHVKFHGSTTIYVKGDLRISGDNKPEFLQGATIFVDGNVSISGSGWPTGSGSEDTPWTVVHVREGLSISGHSSAGSTVLPDIAFLMNTSEENAHADVTLSGTSVTYGGIYAPNRHVSVTGGGSGVWGSIIANTIHSPDLAESEYASRYEQFQDRMLSFRLGSMEEGSRHVERLLEWREVREL